MLLIFFCPLLETRNPPFWIYAQIKHSTEANYQREKRCHWPCFSFFYRKISLYPLPKCSGFFLNKKCPWDDWKHCKSTFNNPDITTFFLLQPRWFTDYLCLTIQRSERDIAHIIAMSRNAKYSITDKGKI